LSRANTVANSGLGLAFTKVTTQSEKKKESKDEKA